MQVTLATAVMFVTYVFVMYVLCSAVTGGRCSSVMPLAEHGAVFKVQPTTTRTISHPESRVKVRRVHFDLVLFLQEDSELMAQCDVPHMSIISLVLGFSIHHLILVLGSFQDSNFLSATGLLSGSVKRFSSMIRSGRDNRRILCYVSVGLVLVFFLLYYLVSRIQR